MAKLADALDLGSSGLSVGVQVPSPAPLTNLFELFELWYIEINQNDWFFSFYKKKIIRKVGVYDKYYQKRNWCRRIIKKEIINGSIRKVDKTNLSYIEPHKIIINNNVFLAFNYSNEIYINNLSRKIKINELENYIKSQN